MPTPKPPKDPGSKPQLLQIKKYPNRRLYDSTRSCHLTHEELYDLVVGGHTVRVTDSKSGADITNLVLAQALIERCPEKFATFPPEVSHLMIRASEQMLRGLASGWFAQVVRGMGGAGGAGTTPLWPSIPGFPWPGMATPSPSPAPAAVPDPVADLHAKMEAHMDALRREIAELKTSRGAPKAGG